MMIREPLQSSSLKSAGYDEGRMTMDIEFLNGDIYRYANVPVEIYTDFMDAESHGKFYVRYIRDSFEFQKLKQHI
jgi:hypothetical protein